VLFWAWLLCETADEFAGWLAGDGGAVLCDLAHIHASPNPSSATTKSRRKTVKNPGKTAKTSSKASKGHGKPTKNPGKTAKSHGKTSKNQ
jgi:hypothetical protein